MKKICLSLVVFIVLILLLVMTVEAKQTLNGKTGKKLGKEWIVYSVKKGDNLFLIAKKYTVSVWMIKKWNNLESNLIKPGQKLKIRKIKWRAYEGKASWYGPGFYNKPMANGENYNKNDIFAAHRHFPLWLRVKITNMENGKSIVVLVKDRGPYARRKGRYSREVDLSLEAAVLLGAKEKGVIGVRIEPQNHFNY